VEAFTDAIGLRTLGLGARVIDVLDREIQLVLVPGDGRLAVVELGKADLDVGVDEALLVDASNAL
jgi:hypothetical protein